MSLFLELMGNNERKAVVSIRRLGLPREGFGLVFAYEITEKGYTVRGTIQWDGEPEVAEREDLALVAVVLEDYMTKAKEAGAKPAR